MRGRSQSLGTSDTNKNEERYFEGSARGESPKRPVKDSVMRPRSTSARAKGGGRGGKGRALRKERKESLYSVALRHDKIGNYAAARRLFEMLSQNP